MNRWEFVERTLKFKRAYCWNHKWFSDYDRERNLLYIQHWSTVILVYDVEADRLVKWDGWSASDRNMLNTVFAVLGAPYRAMIRKWKLRVVDLETGREVPRDPLAKLKKDGWGRLTGFKFQVEANELPSWYKYQFVVVCDQDIYPFLEVTKRWAREMGYWVSKPIFERTSNLFAANMILMFRRKDKQPLTDYDRVVLTMFDDIATHYLSSQINIFEGRTYSFDTEAFIEELKEIPERAREYLKSRLEAIEAVAPMLTT